MQNLVIVYDDLDENVGDYFDTSHQALCNKVDRVEGIRLHTFNTENCQANTIDHHIAVCNAQPFIFVSFTHGSEDAILIAGDSYIHLGNAYYFASTLFYACGCLTAKELGPRLLAENCRVFLGYSSKISTINPESDPVFQECETAFLYHFLTTDSTINDSRKFMYQKYEEMKFHLVERFGSFHASVLDENLSAFRIICENDAFDLTRHDFRAAP